MDLVREVELGLDALPIVQLDLLRGAFISDNVFPVHEIYYMDALLSLVCSNWLLGLNALRPVLPDLLEVF